MCLGLLMQCAILVWIVRQDSPTLLRDAGEDYQAAQEVQNASVSDQPPALSVPISFQNSSVQAIRWSGSRSAAGAEWLTRAGAEVFCGHVNKLDHLRSAAEAADGVISRGLQPRLVQLEAEQRGRPQGHRDVG
jgi:hypothetical protein